MAIVRK